MDRADMIMLRPRRSTGRSRRVDCLKIMLGIKSEAMHRLSDARHPWA